MIDKERLIQVHEAATEVLSYFIMLKSIRLKKEVIQESDIIQASIMSENEAPGTIIDMAPPVVVHTNAVLITLTRGITVPVESALRTIIIDTKEEADQDRIPINIITEAATITITRATANEGITAAPARRKDMKKPRTLWAPLQPPGWLSPITSRVRAWTITDKGTRGSVEKISLDITIIQEARVNLLSMEVTKISFHLHDQIFIHHRECREVHTNDAKVMGGGVLTK